MAIGLDVTKPPEPENPEEYDYETCPFRDVSLLR
jgi:small subunit ribosomal protein S17